MANMTFLLWCALQHLTAFVEYYRVIKGRTMTPHDLTHATL